MLGQAKRARQQLRSPCLIDNRKILLLQIDYLVAQEFGPYRLLKRSKQ